MELTKEMAIIEAILFLENESINKKSIIRIADLPEHVVETAVEAIRKKYQSDDHGIELVEISGGYTFSPKEEFWGLLKDHYGKKITRLI